MALDAPGRPGPARRLGQRRVRRPCQGLAGVQGLASAGGTFSLLGRGHLPLSQLVGGRRPDPIPCCGGGVRRAHRALAVLELFPGGSPCGCRSSARRRARTCRAARGRSGPSKFTRYGLPPPPLSSAALEGASLMRRICGSAGLSLGAHGRVSVRLGAPALPAASRSDLLDSRWSAPPSIARTLPASPADRRRDADRRLPRRRSRGPCLPGCTAARKARCGCPRWRPRRLGKQKVRGGGCKHGRGGATRG